MRKVRAKRRAVAKRPRAVLRPIKTRTTKRRAPRKTENPDEFNRIVANARRRILECSGVDLPDSEIVHLIRPPKTPALQPPAPKTKDELMRHLRDTIEDLYQLAHDLGYEVGREEGTCESDGWED